jgi:hypothetical protein
MQFTSKKQMARALLEGKRFKNHRGVVIYYDANLQNPFRCGLNSMDRVWEDYSEDIWEEVETGGPTPVINGAWDLCHRNAVEEAKYHNVHQHLVDSYQVGQAWQCMPAGTSAYRDCIRNGVWVEPEWDESTAYRLHPHNELIQAHRDGAKIQYYAHGEWIEETYPAWYEGIQYRIKPDTNIVYEWMYHERETDDWIVSKYLMNEFTAEIFFADAPYQKTGRSWEVPA